MMKTVMMLVMAISLAGLLGCATVNNTVQSIPPEQRQQIVYTVANLTVTGLLHEKPISEENKASIVAVVTTLKAITPVYGALSTDTNRLTYTKLMSLPIQAIAMKIVKEKGLSDSAVPLIVAGASTVSLAVDIVLARHPEWVTTQEELNLIIGAVCDGALSALTATQ